VPWQLPARLERSAQALVAEVRRQADVDDGDVPLLCDDLAYERLAVSDRGDDFEAIVAQQAREPVAQQRQVFG